MPKLSKANKVKLIDIDPERLNSVGLEPLTGERTDQASACYSREHSVQTSQQALGPRSL